MNHNREHRDRPKVEKPKRGGGSLRTKQRRFQRKVAQQVKPPPFFWPLVPNNLNFNQHELT